MPKGQDPYCFNCRFWAGNRRYGGKGNCIRHSPKIGRESGGVHYPAWPQTDEDAWCGDHEPAAIEVVLEDA